jgi:hypothetical protein
MLDTGRRSVRIGIRVGWFPFGMELLLQKVGESGLIICAHRMLEVAFMLLMRS